MKGIILAAGYGTRLGELGRRIPKALLPVRGKPVINFLLEQLSQIGITETILVTNERFNHAFCEWLKNKKPPLSVELLCDGTTKPENRLGAVRDMDLALKKIPGGTAVFITASDNLYTGDLSVLIKRFEETKAPVVALIRQEDKEILQRSGVAQIDSEGRIVKFVEKPEVPPGPYAAPPFYIYPDDIKDDIEAFLKDPSLDHDAPGNLVSFLVERRTVYGVVLDGKRHDIGDLKSYKKIQQEFMKEKG